MNSNIKTIRSNNFNFLAMVINNLYYACKAFNKMILIRTIIKKAKKMIALKFMIIKILNQKIVVILNKISSKIITTMIL